MTEEIKELIQRAEITTNAEHRIANSLLAIAKILAVALEKGE